MIRVQSGAARGRRLKALPAGLEVRPILARIRKSLFDILRPRLADTRFLDLFAGTGAVGIEALSNGAARAVFVDLHRSSLKMIERNLAELGFAAQAEVVQGDATKNLVWLGREPFALIFMGPPYKDERKRPLALTIPALKAVNAAGLAAPGAWIIGQHHEKEILKDLPEDWEIFRQNNYGDSVLTFFRKKGA